MNKFLRQLAGATGFIKTTISGGDHVPSVNIDGLPLPSAYATAQATIGTSVVQITAVSTPIKTVPVVVTDPDNTGNVVVTQAGGTAASGVTLGKGQALLVPVDNLNKIWVVGSTASQKVAVIAGT